MPHLLYRAQGAADEENGPGAEDGKLLTAEPASAVIKRARREEAIEEKVIIFLFLAQMISGQTDFTTLPGRHRFLWQTHRGQEEWHKAGQSKGRREEARGELPLQRGQLCSRP